DSTLALQHPLTSKRRITLQVVHCSLTRSHQAFISLDITKTKMWALARILWVPHASPISCLKSIKRSLRERRLRTIHPTSVRISHLPSATLLLTRATPPMVGHGAP